jgi:hypothetical protein
MPLLHAHTFNICLAPASTTNLPDFFSLSMKLLMVETTSFGGVFRNYIESNSWGRSLPPPPLLLSTVVCRPRGRKSKRESQRREPANLRRGANVGRATPRKSLSLRHLHFSPRSSRDERTAMMTRCGNEDRGEISFFPTEND